MITRYALRIDNPEGGYSYNLQGMPNVPADSDGFEFAILYASVEHAKKAAKNVRGFDFLKKNGFKFMIVPVQCVLHVAHEIESF